MIGMAGRLSGKSCDKVDDHNGARFAVLKKLFESQIWKTEAGVQQEMLELFVGV